LWVGCIVSFVTSVLEVELQQKGLLFVSAREYRGDGPSPSLKVLRAIGARKGGVKVMEVTNFTRQVDEILSFDCVVPVIDGQHSSLWRPLPTSRVMGLPEWAQVARSCAVVAPVVVHHEKMIEEVAQEIFRTFLRDFKKGQLSLAKARLAPGTRSVEKISTIRRVHSAAIGSRVSIIQRP